jgi:MOSC domain-containing protein YiiM
VDECEVTLIEAEDLEAIERDSRVKVTNGEHRRNLVTRGIRLLALSGKRLQVGDVLLEFDRPRPPCSYIQSLTEPGMTRALARAGGVCARVVKSGRIRVDDLIKVVG